MMPTLKFVARNIVALSMIFLLIEVLFDPISLIGNSAEKSEAQREISIAKEQWKANGSGNYEIKVRGGFPMGCLYDAILTVRQGKLVNVQAKEFLFENSKYKTLEKEKWNSYPCDYKGLVVSEILNNAERAINRIDPSLQKPKISFDPKFGYLTYYQINYHRYGLFTSIKVSDCCSWYEYSDYEPME